jgi:hypothetical protein
MAVLKTIDLSSGHHALKNSLICKSLRIEKGGKNTCDLRHLNPKKIKPPAVFIVYVTAVEQRNCCFNIFSFAYARGAFLYIICTTVNKYFVMKEKLNKRDC